LPALLKRIRNISADKEHGAEASNFVTLAEAQNAVSLADEAGPKSIN
jgi:hypothetical protein